MAKKITVLSLSLASAMLLSYIETLVPPLSGIPGIKIGLANIAVIFVLLRLGIKEAIAVSLTRVLLSALLFGNFIALIYSICGAALSLLVMILLKKINLFSVIGISIAGGVAHNVGQIAAAIIILGSSAIIYYLPFLLISGTVSGALIGIAAGLFLKRFDKLIIKK